MDKVEGLPLSQIWNTLKMLQKLQVLLAMTRLQKQWMNVSFSHYGSFFYATDVKPLTGNHYARDGKTISDSTFAIGPTTERDWFGASRSLLDIEKGPYERIKQDSDDAVAGTEPVVEAKETMGDLWPDKGFIEHEHYDDCKAALREVKAQILEQLADNDKKRAEYKRYWPFE
ncbi:hypothetical protein TSTA_095740 [Talaromyces stipitatus ATCC 10500]|uniref:Uncharacterized protein n=1 Tax=Talaromyces stipitatus (strain ATCC 10500 / CBS 375.48 / QM 6759 / NRRL 1006) TaxID=441959 RepID=B8M3F3_TALSN|nr:uncharacterized protein TSTA_095740 [Talaromyces stipitatus ATCC 10500]EED22325.1 hypothetical protein TSTA_095740 [Talaromyces stipitatus ATCC 10500]